MIKVNLAAKLIYSYSRSTDASGPCNKKLVINRRDDE